MYLPIVIVAGGAFLAVLAWFVHQGFATGGSVFGSGTGATARAGTNAPTSGPPAVNVEGGGPPATVRIQLAQLRERIDKNPKDDVALTQLGDMYLAVGKYADAIPYYRRALAANAKNVAAQEGLSEARAGLKGGQ